MKRFITIIMAAFLTLIIGAFVLIPINNLISYLADIQAESDNANTMAGFIFFVEWPLLLIIGGIFGNWLYKKYLTKTSNGQSKAS
ncbi:hypothetical protein MNBD_GAMMA20-309 [hydrothermal vent metagenome]|uniref:Uncharacterized protein n=1 Tax=hydrothermal vent metagenome TaxID=652676 RepID=A0A3B1AQS0_9ZZZZ